MKVRICYKVTDTRTPTAGEIALRWKMARLDGLSPREVYEMLALRQRVFVVEQHCAYQDADGLDPSAWHLLGWEAKSDKPTLIAYARIFEPGIRYTEGSIGRVVTEPDARGRGIGRELMREALRRCAELFPGNAVRLGAQMRLEKFYEDFGFATVSKPYVEDDILHVEMLRKIPF